jgi:hypothetical protein
VASGSRDFSHVYVAQCGEFAKIGASRNPQKRVQALGGKLVQFWKVSSAYEVEGTAIWLLAQTRDRDRREWFKAPTAEAIAAVVEAIHRVSHGDVAPFTVPRTRRQREAVKEAGFRAAVEDVNKWAAENPEAFEQQIRTLDEIAKQFPGSRGRDHASRQAIYGIVRGAPRGTRKTKR